jgi:hypothetical protein
MNHLWSVTAAQLYNVEDPTEADEANGRRAQGA